MKKISKPILLAASILLFCSGAFANISTNQTNQQDLTSTIYSELEMEELLHKPNQKAFQENDEDIGISDEELEEVFKDSLASI